MKVFFDSEIFLLQKSGGVSRYFTEVFEQLLEKPSLGIEPNLTFERTSNLHLKETLLKNSIPIKNIEIPYFSPISPKRAFISYGPLKFLNSSISAESAKIGLAAVSIGRAEYRRVMGGREKSQVARCGCCWRCWRQRSSRRSADGGERIERRMRRTD